MGRPEFHRLAERELNAATQYYDGEEELGLGGILPSGGIRILAVMNLKRRPTYWGVASDTAAAAQLLLSAGGLRRRLKHAFAPLIRENRS